LATGATHSYFGHPEWEARAPGLKTLSDALEIRRRILFAYEAAEREPEKRQAWLTFVVIGGGPTGVEMAGAMAEISRHALRRDFRNIRSDEAKILLLEGADRLLLAYPPELSQKAKLQLERLGVEARLDTRVTGIDDNGVAVTTKTGDAFIASQTVVWAAGVQASPLAKSLGVPLDRAGRVLVTPTLNVPGHDDVYIVGDLASLTDNGKPIPGVAPAAIQGGQYVAEAILTRLKQQPVEPFHYRDKGSLATIGRAAAVADFGRVRFGGFFAWAAWLFIHILFLIGFRNRAIVLLQWFWAYITFQRSARLIIDNPETKALLPPAVAKKA
jgi:NADH dehydrogenase